MDETTHRLLIVCGPSNVGKSPLRDVLEDEFPDLTLESPVLYNSRAPRPDEEDGVDYHFRSEEEIEELEDEDGFLVVEIEDTFEAVDVGELAEMLGESDVIYEGNPAIGLGLQEREELEGFDIIDVFISPLDRSEVEAFQDTHVGLEPLLKDLSRRRLLRRKAGSRPFLSLPDLEDVEDRAERAYKDLQQAPRFTWVLPNHDGEDSEHWQAFPHPIGDARKAVYAVAGLLRGEESDILERWPEDLFDSAD